MTIKIQVATIDHGKEKQVRLDGLTFLRFIAAFYVFIFHFDSRFALPLSQYSKNIVSNGAIAMPIFFMLSGFVLTYNYAHAYRSFTSYYLTRVARIYPAYILCVVLCLPLLPIFDQLIGLKLAVSAVIIILISIFLVQAWFPNLFTVWHFSGTWSVSVEMYLYAAYPVSRHLTALTSKQILVVIFGLILASASLVPSLRLSFSRDIPFSIFYVIPPYHLPEFLIGCGLATLYLRRQTNSYWLAVGLLIVPFLGFFGADNTRFMLFNGVLLPMIACNIIGFAASGTSNNKALIALVTNPVSRYLGETSYSFFLMQIPLLLLAEQHKKLLSDLNSLQLFFCFLITTQAMASFSYHYVERPGQRALMRFFQKMNFESTPGLSLLRDKNDSIS